MMKEVMVGIEDAKGKVKSYQCPHCDHFEFEKESAKKVMKELKEESPLRIRQKVIKLSSNRLGIYFNKDVARSLELKAGEEISVSVPSKKKMVIELD